MTGALKVGVFCGEEKSHQSEPRAALGSLGVLVANPMLAWLSLPCCWPIFQGPTVILFLPTDLQAHPWDLRVTSGPRVVAIFMEDK